MPDDFAGSIVSRSARHPIPGMRPVSAKIQAFHRSCVPGPAKQRPHRENLIQRKLAMKRMPASQSVSRFQIGRRKSLHAQNLRWKIGRILSDGLDDGVAKRIALLRPAAGLQQIRRELHVNRHHMLASRRECVVLNRWKGNIKVWRGRKFSVLGVVECPLEIIDPGPDMNPSRKRPRRVR